MDLFSVANTLTPTTTDQMTQVWAMGVLVTLKIFGNQTGGLMSSFEDEVSPGIGPPLHYHTLEDETWTMLEGGLTWIIGENQHDVTDGDVIFIPRGTPHAFVNKSGKNARMLVIYTPAGQENWFVEIGKPVHDPAKPPEISPEERQAAIKIGEEKYAMVFLPPKQAPAAKDEL
ncbi:hypothetical protein R1sor_004288 [Riccia sorocarpa]|uniref:Cupin type-2 domain-containing protein n=1 Tax=Riccia sorocarpa TaxID=122646 RepID=A0ABD3HJ70_9MARC